MKIEEAEKKSETEREDSYTAIVNLIRDLGEIYHEIKIEDITKKFLEKMV